LLLHLRSATYRPANAVAARLDDVTGMLLYREIDYLSAQRTRSLEGFPASSRPIRRL
jgi:hypothetical protein